MIDQADTIYLSKIDKVAEGDVVFPDIPVDFQLVF